MRVHLYLISCLLTLVLAMGQATAQDDCAANLANATKVFLAGKYEQVIELMANRIDSCHYTRADRELAVKLLSASYQNLDELEKAEDLVYHMLRKNPVYEAQASMDPAGFVSVLNKFNRMPRLSLGASLGRMSTMVIRQKNYALARDGNYDNNYSVQGTMAFSLFMQYHLGYKWSVVATPIVAPQYISRDIAFGSQFSMTYLEHATLIGLPVMVSYKAYELGNFSVSALAGMHYSQYSNYTYELYYKLEGQGTSELKGTLDNKRNKTNYGYCLGLNLNYQHNRMRYFGNLSFATNMELQNKPEERYDLGPVILDYYYVDEDFSVDRLELKVGMAYTLTYKIAHKYLQR